MPKISPKSKRRSNEYNEHQRQKTIIKIKINIRFENENRISGCLCWTIVIVQHEVFSEIKKRLL